MKRLNKKIALLLCLAAMSAALLGLSITSASASTLDTFEPNDGSATDFQDTWGQGSMSADIIDGDKTLVRAQKIAFGLRMVDNYKQEFNGATFDADFRLSGKNDSKQTVYYAPGDAGQYFDGGGLNIFVIENGNTGDAATIKVGWWKPDVGMTEAADTLYWSKSYTDIPEGVLNIKSELRMNEDGSWLVKLNVNGAAEEIPVTADQWNNNTRGTEGYMGCAALVEGTGNIFIVFNGYNDAKRTAYRADESLADAFTGLAAMKTAYLTAQAFTDDTSLSEASDVLYTVTVNRSLITSNEDVRRFEKGSADWYYDNTLKILEDKFQSDEQAYALVQLGVSVNYFYEESKTMTTEADVARVDALKQNVDYDKLDELAAMGFEGADEIIAKYNEAKNRLADKKDEYVAAHLAAFETAVADLGTNEKMLEAAELQKAVILTDAKAANRAAYTARYDTAVKTLVGSISGYAGDLADRWDIHNVTFVKANKHDEISYQASDYYNNDSTNDVGVTLKGKVKLDGLSMELTVQKGDYNKDSWFGFFITGQRQVFVSAAETGSGGLPESRGVITLLKPFAADEEAETDAFTQLRMGYPNLYGNEGDVIAQVDADLYGNTMKFEFAKENDAEGVAQYNCYVTVTDAEEKTVVERFLAKSMLASTVDAELDAEGMGYLTFGSCDKTLCGVEATVHTINGRAAATFTGKADEQEPDPVPGGNEGGGDKKGCGSVAGGFAGGGTYIRPYAGGCRNCADLKKAQNLISGYRR